MVTLRVGALLPGSGFVPFLASDLAAALELGLREGGIDPDLAVEAGAFNADHKVVAAKLQDLCLKHRVDVLVAPLNVALASPLADLLEGERVPLVVPSLGEDVWFADATRSSLFVNNFHLWRSAWMCGYAGAGRFGPSACTLIALHDGGYGMAFAFGLGLEANNGRLLQLAVTHQASRTEDPSPFISAVTAQNPDFIWALHSGKEAISLLTAYRALGCGIPLMGLLPLVDVPVLDAVGETAVGIPYVSAWPPPTDAHERFVTAFHRVTGHAAHPYALLAYECGHLIADAARRLPGGRPDRDALPDALHDAAFDGPRGRIAFDHRGRETTTPLYLREIVRGDDGRPVSGDATVLDLPPLLDEHYALAGKNLVKQGWVNPYLCG